MEGMRLTGVRGPRIQVFVCTGLLLSVWGYRDGSIIATRMDLTIDVAIYVDVVCHRIKVIADNARTTLQVIEVSVGANVQVVGLHR